MLQHFVEQPRIHPDVVFDPGKEARIARNRILEPVQHQIDHISHAGFNYFYSSYSGSNAVWPTL